MTRNRTYVVICGFADVVAGGPIYYANKIKYMEERGWHVVVIPTNKGNKVLIHGMEKYLGPYVPFILDLPSEYVKRQREKLVDYLESFVPHDAGETIIETGTDYTAYWGEALAKRIRARHFVIFLDEQNSRIDERTIGFYQFKYHRHEMACITKRVMQHMFRDYMDLSLNQCYAVSCDCTNSISDYDHPLTHQIGRHKFNIGYIGRLEKPFMPAILEGFENFCKQHVADDILIVFFGGAFEQKTIDNIREKFNHLSNVQLIISGYLYPLPLQALNKMDVFVSGAGSANVAFKSGSYSVNVDILSYKPLGIVIGNNPYRYAKCPIGSSVADYLNWVLIDKIDLPSKPQPSYENDWSDVENSFSGHIEFMAGAVSDLQYYNLDKLRLSRRQKYKKLLRAILGIKLYNTIHNGKLYISVWNLFNHVRSKS